jgi:CheY-like chemotaxis protein
LESAFPELLVVALSRIRVLIVDDDANGSLLPDEIMEKADAYDFAFAGTIADALVLIEKAPPDVAVLGLTIAGQPNAPIVAALRSRSIPFAITTFHEASQPPNRDAVALKGFQLSFNQRLAAALASLR